MAAFDFRLLSFIGIKETPKAPWSKNYKKSMMKIHLNDESFYDYLKNKSLKNGYGPNVAISYYGNKITYNELFHNISLYAKKFLSLGVRKYDIVTIISANIPEAIFAVYALNKIGAVANMLHPLLSKNEIKNALNEYNSKVVLTMDIMAEKVASIINETNVEKVIIASPSSYMNIFLKGLYKFKNFKEHYRKYFKNNFITIDDFLKLKHSNNIYISKALKDDPALILQSGGSTGTPKGIVLSNGNINASTISALNSCEDLSQNDKALGIMPIFHGFGLAVSINDVLCVGAEVVLVPAFKADRFHKLLIKHNPTILIGVPTLYEALTTNSEMEKVDLSQLNYVISGGDTLSKDRVEKINEFLAEHGAKTKMIQGYGLTEAVAAASMDRKDSTKPGTIGIPWPGVYIGIFEVGGEKQLPYDTDGEICVCGPTVMLGYYNNEAETNKALRYHKDGNIWLHTGDIGSMDKEGYITYKQRIKRMIVSSGYNVYPSQIEEVLRQHEAVLNTLVIGIPHKYKGEVAKAFIVLKKGYKKSDKLKNEIETLCKDNLAHYAVPKEYEFINSLPKTVVGKVDFMKLQEKEKLKEIKNEKKQKS